MSRSAARRSTGTSAGNGTHDLRGNVYEYQLAGARRLFEALTPGERERATLPHEPVQTQIELRGSSAVPPGVRLGEASPSARRLADELVAAILETYPARDVEYARACLEANGGVDALALSRYEEGEEGPTGPCQIFRLEGPAAVFHFRGHPHVHAFLNVGMDGDRPLSVGEPLGHNPAPLEGDAVRALFEDAMCHATGTEVGYYAPESVVGRLRTGEIRSGDVYNLESWQDHIAVVDVEAGSLRADVLAALEKRGIDPDPTRDRTVATSGYVADELASERLGRIVAVSRGVTLRDATVAYLRQHGFGERG